MSEFDHEPACPCDALGSGQTVHQQVALGEPSWAIREEAGPNLDGPRLEAFLVGTRVGEGSLSVTGGHSKLVSRTGIVDQARQSIADRLTVLSAVCVSVNTRADRMPSLRCDRRGSRRHRWPP